MNGAASLLKFNASLSNQTNFCLEKNKRGKGLSKEHIFFPSSLIKAFKLNMLIIYLIKRFFENFIVPKDAPLSPGQFDVNISFSPKS